MDGNDGYVEETNFEAPIAQLDRASAYDHTGQRQVWLSSHVHKIVKSNAHAFNISIKEYLDMLLSEKLHIVDVD